MNNKQAAQRAAVVRKQSGAAVALRRAGATAVILGAVSGTAAAITFPSTPIESKCFIARNPDYTQPYTSWDWIDASSRVQWDQGITIEAGKGARDDTPRASTASFKVLNTDGELSRNNPTSSNYGLISRHNPVWIQQNVGDGFKDRYFGWTTDLPKNISHFKSTIDITCRDALDHLLQTQSVKSPIFRTVTGKNNPYPPYQYWPLEEKENATQFANAAGAGRPAEFVTFAGSEPLPGDDSSIPGGTPVLSIPSITNVTFRIPSYTDTGRHVHMIAIRIPDSADALAGLAVYTSSYQLTGLLDRTTLNVSAKLNSTGATIFNNSDTLDEAIADKWVTLVISSQDTGGGGDILHMEVLNQSGTVIAQTIDVNGGVYETARFGQVGNQSPAGVSSVGVGHYQVIIDDLDDFDITNSPVPYAKSLGAWNNEQMHVRGARIAAEEGFDWFCQAGTSEELGFQASAKAVDVLREGAKADNGYLYAYKFGLAYKAHSEFLNQPVTLALDADSGHLPKELQSVDNTQNFYNRWTVRRNDGSSSIEEIQGGIAEGEPIFAGDDTFNLYTDSQTRDLASFLANRDAGEPEQWPYIPISLTKNPGLIVKWREMTEHLGKRFTVDGLSGYSGIPFLDLVLDGYIEHWNSKQYDVEINGSDGSFFQVGSLDSTTFRLDSQSSEILADLTSSQTYFEVYTSDRGDIWTTTRAHSEDFPLDIVIAGEDMRATDIDGAVYDSFTRTESNGWGTADTDQVWTTSGGAAGDYSVDGSVGKITIPTSDTTERFVLLQSAIYSDISLLATTKVSDLALTQSLYSRIIFRRRDSDSSYRLLLAFRTDGTVDAQLYSQVNGTSTLIGSHDDYVTYSAGSNVFVRIDAYGSSIKVKLWTSGDEPIGHAISVTSTTWQKGYIGVSGAMQSGNTNTNPVVSFDNFQIANPQGFTVTRSLNGITKAHKANMGKISEVHVRYPIRLTL